MAKGGSRYGAGRPGYKLAAESLKRVDVRLWARRGYFDDSLTRSFTWSWTRGGEPSGSISVSTSARETVLNYRLQPVGSDEWEPKRNCARMSTTPCRFGGVRHWFHCPTCGRRCEVLYMRFGRFACRKCNRVAYTSQRGDALDRLTHKLHKLRARMDDGRPRGMHRQTWDRLIEEMCDVETRAESLLAARAIALFGRAAFS
jgi:hypothetical protein